MYQLVVNGDRVVRLSDGAIIPFAPGNSDYTTYLQWCDDGNVPYPAVADDPKEVAQAAITVLEQATQMNRLMREFMLVSMQDLAQRQSELLAEHGITISPQELLMQRSGWTKLVEINRQATALRALL